MIYKDGYEVDENLRFIKCPRCGNEEFAPEAKYCRICGFPTSNDCDGSPAYDEFGNQEGFYIHKNYGNARFCEHCGKTTLLFKEKLLKPYNEVESEQETDEMDMPFPFELDDSMPF